MSSIEYYKGINEEYMKLKGKVHCMPQNPTMLMASADCDAYACNLQNHDYDLVYRHHTDHVNILTKMGIDFLVIASGSAHMSIPLMMKENPTLKVLHIADCMAVAIKAQGLKCVALLGTEPTMREQYIKGQLAKHGITTIVPV